MARKDQQKGVAKLASAGRQIVASNRKARHDYEILETLEAGMVLVGAEVKSLREAKVQIRDAYARVERGEMLLLGLHINQYAYSHAFRPNPDRARKLLLHKRQIVELGNRLAQEGLVLIPLDIHFVDGRAKVDLGLAKPRKLHDKRHAIADRDAARDISRELSRHRSGKASLDG